MSSNNSEEIVDFIKRRFYNTNANWLNGNCYWFAKILAERFEGLKIYYEPIRGHFISGDGNHFYDYTGLLTELDSNPILLSDIAKSEPNMYKRLVEDCIL